jgi:ribosomal protein L37AE/L43A
MSRHRPECMECGKPYQYEREALGYDTCTSCGEKLASEVKHTIAPLHKSNYMVVNPEELKGINNKGGFHR